MANITSKGLKKDKSTKVFSFFFSFSSVQHHVLLFLKKKKKKKKKKTSHSALSLRVPNTPPTKALEFAGDEES